MDFSFCFVNIYFVCFAICYFISRCYNFCLHCIYRRKLNLSTKITNRLHINIYIANTYKVLSTFFYLAIKVSYFFLFLYCFFFKRNVSLFFWIFLDLPFYSVFSFIYLIFIAFYTKYILNPPAQRRFKC